MHELPFTRLALTLKGLQGGLAMHMVPPPSMMLRTRPSKGWMSVLPHPQQGSAMALSFIVVTLFRKVFVTNNTLCC